MRFDKLIYIRYIPLTAKVFTDFYMDEAIKSGVRVEYWDITRLFFKSDFGMEDSSHLMCSKKFISYEQLEEEIALEKNRSKTLFISTITFEARVGRLYKILTKYNCTIAAFGRNIFPLPSTDIGSKLKRLKLRDIIPKLFNYINALKIKKQKLNGVIKSYDIVFIGGKLGWRGIGDIDYNEVFSAEIVKLNSNDYDDFLRLKNSESLIIGDYILFLDQYLPLHPDTRLLGIRSISIEYYSELCRYFDRVEKKFGLPVIIAAHPKALRYRDEDFFEGRKIYFGKSAELSKHASFILAHNSTSINYPIAFNKKLHFITSKNIEKEMNNTHRHVIHFANYLECNYQWFDSNEDIDVIDEIPIVNYNKYKYDFQTWSETENTLSNEIFLKFIK